MSEEARSSLARAQADLVRALTIGDRQMPNFDPVRLALAREMLVKKRARAVARAWPVLPQSLDQFDKVFSEYSAAHPRTAATNSTADALTFINFLLDRHQLPDAAYLQWLAHRATRSYLAVARLQQGKCVAIAFRFPGRSQIHLIQF